MKLRYDKAVTSYRTPRKLRISTRQLIWILGAVAADRLEVVKPVLVNVTITGTSPAPANEAGRVKLMMSNPGISKFDFESEIVELSRTVVPIVIPSSVFNVTLTPVRLSSTIVGTWVPVPSSDVTLNGGDKR